MAISNKTKKNIIVFVAWLFLMFIFAVVLDPMMRPLDTIRENMLAQTPIGTSREDVMALVGSRAYTLRPIIVTFERESTVTARIGRAGGWRGSGRYVHARWYFDINGNLREMVVWRSYRAFSATPGS